MLVRPVYTNRERSSTMWPTVTGLWKVMPLTDTVTHGSPLHPAAHAYAASSIHFIMYPPCTLP